MDISPQTIRSTGFKTVKKGYDPQEVDSFRFQVATAVEAAQNQATAMEARARAAVAKLQEVSQQAQGASRDTAAPPGEDAEIISRTLLLAQRTADSTLGEARSEADSITAHAREEASRVLDSARLLASKTVDDARFDARRAAEDDRVKAENEVQALLARRDFLLADVDHLEQYLQSQRDRLRDAAVQLQELVERVPGGLAEMRRPLLSASAEPLPAENGAPSAGSVESRPPAPPVPPAPAPTPASDAEPLAVPSPAPVPDEPSSSAAGDASSSFAPTPERPADLTAMALSSDADANENVWRLLDEEVASTQAAQAALSLDDVPDRGQVRQPPPERFSSGGDDLQ